MTRPRTLARSHAWSAILNEVTACNTGTLPSYVGFRETQHVSATRSRSMSRSLRGRAMIIAVSVFAAACSSGSPSISSNRGAPSISGSDIEGLLRSKLGPASGSQADVDSIRCPRSRSFLDGGLARCTMKQFDGTAVVLLVTLLRIEDKWSFTIDIQ